MKHPAPEFDEATHNLPRQRLTSHEFHVFLRIACGQSLSEIAQTLGVTVTTISTHRANTREKMQLPDDALVHYTVLHELIQDDDD